MSKSPPITRPVRTTPPKDPIENVDWHLEYKRANLNHDMTAPWVWEFTLRTTDIEGMKALGRVLRKAKYVTAEQESVTESTHVPSRTGKGKGKWKTVEGPPMVTAFCKGKASAAALKRRVVKLLAIAKEHRAKYEGMSSWDLEEFQMVYGPPRAMSLADAVWRLRHHSDLGLDHGEAMPFIFGIATEEVTACKAALKKAGFTKASRAPKDANWDLTVEIEGANDEKRLRKEFAAMKKVAKAAGGTLVGMLV
ncbi:MAG: hypothetical protein ACOYN0_09525 [Phycisphaerales bacterium]